MRLSPFDPWAFAAFDAQAMSHFVRGRYEAALRAAYKSVHANPAHSITYVQLAAALSKLGRIERPAPPLRGFWSFIRPSVTAGNSRGSAAPVRWQCLSAKPYETLDFQNSTAVRWGPRAAIGGGL